MIAFVDNTETIIGYESVDDRPCKRARLAEVPDSSALTEAIPTDEIDPASVGTRHPLGIRPAGNAYLSTHNLKDASGSFAAWPDELIAAVLETLDLRAVLLIGSTCKALHAFTRNEELWRALFTASPPTTFRWRGTWRSTLLGHDRSLEPRIDCSHVFSDVLHRPFFCAHIPLEPYVTNIPPRNQIRRVSDCTSDEIFDKDQPLLLTNVARQWPAFKDWSIDALLAKYADTKFRAEAVDWTLRDYYQYLRNNTDESPLYLFDSRFAEKMALYIPDSPARSGNTESDATPRPAYWPPACFGHNQDLFSVLGPQRPDHRWLIIGPARSGSTFHKDPNGTCAWNAVLRGRKYWLMFPSSSSLPPPPGIFVSADQSEVTSPQSIAEYLLAFHAQARTTPGCKEGICEEGEMIYVPAGWYHLVLNLSESIALTQNFVPRHRLADVLAFLRDRADQVSGFSDDVGDPYGLFVDRLEQLEPDLLVEAQAVLEKRGAGLHGQGRSRWDEIKAGDDEAGGFLFGFGGDVDDDDE